MPEHRQTGLLRGLSNLDYFLSRVTSLKLSQRESISEHFRSNLLIASYRLKTSLMELRIDCSMEPNVELLDIDFNNLQNLVNAAHAEHRLQKSLNPDPRVVSLGAVLIEAISAAFWSDAVLVRKFRTYVVLCCKLTVFPVLSTRK